MMSLYLYSIRAVLVRYHEAMTLVAGASHVISPMSSVPCLQSHVMRPINSLM